MQSPQRSIASSPDVRDPRNLKGWDIGLAAFALACMTTGFWRLWPGALFLEDIPLGPMILQAGLASLGFIAIAVRWEDTWRALMRNPLALVFLVLVCSSAIWAMVPTDAVRNAILLILIWVFGMALALRFQPRELAEICAFAAVLGLLAHFAGHRAVPPSTSFDGDISFAIIGSAWAAWAVSERRSLWILALASSVAVACVAGDVASLGAGIGLLVGCGVAQLSAIRSRQGTISIIVTAWVLVALTFGVTLFALFGADPLTASLSQFVGGLGPNMMIGQGFAVSGQSIASALGAGLGIVGIGLAGLVAFGTLFQILLSRRQIDHGVTASVAIWFGVIGAILGSPNEVGIFSPIVILFAATSFIISLSCVPSPKSRRALRLSAGASRALSTIRPAPLQTSAAQPPATRLNALGLRPKH